MPRTERARGQRRTLGRRPLLIAAIALLVATGLALAATVSVRYFGDQGDAVPFSVQKALLHPLSAQGPNTALAFDQTVVAYTFSSTSGSGRVYVTPYADGKGFCAALAVRGKPVQASCANGVIGRTTTLIGSLIRPWSVTLTPDMHAMLGRLLPSAQDESVRLAFEDSTTSELPKRGRWFAYAVTGTRTTAGHRPVELQFLRDGRVIRRIPLNPTTFNTLAEARTLVPRSDGSEAQDAIRRMLLDRLVSPIGDGGQQAAHTQIAATRFVTSLRLGKGLLVRVYATPTSPRPPVGAGMLVTGIDGRSPTPIFSAGMARSSDAARLEGASCACGVPGHPEARFSMMTGNVPRGATTVSVRTEGGRELPAVLFDHGRSWIFLARETVTPTRLVARDAAGTIVLTRSPF